MASSIAARFSSKCVAIFSGKVKPRLGASFPQPSHRSLEHREGKTRIVTIAHAEGTGVARNDANSAAQTCGTKLGSAAGRQPERSLVPAPTRSPSSSASGTGSGGGSGSVPAQPRSCLIATMLQRLLMGLASVREPRLVRERFEEDLRALVRARSVTFRHDA